MRRFKDCLLGLEVKVGHGLHVGQDAGGDHQGQHVHGNQEDCTHGKCDEQAKWNLSMNIFTSFAVLIFRVGEGICNYVRNK